MKSLEYIEIDADEFASVDRAAAFDGTNDYLTRGAGLTGAADSDKLTFSLWVYLAEGDSGRIIASTSSVGGGDGRSRIVFAAGTRVLQAVMVNASGTTVLDVNTTAFKLRKWYHVMGSFDLSTDPVSAHLYVNNAPDLTTVVATPGETIDFTAADWGIGAYPDGSSKLFGRLADVWFQPGVYVDLSIAANRRKFVKDPTGPIDLGAAGANPTGSSPLIFLSGALASWHTNKGTGGGFTENGELDIAGYVWETWRFAVPTDYLPKDIPAITSISGINVNPGTVSLGKDLGQRASVTVNLKDHLFKFNTEGYNDGTFWGKWRGRHLTKFRNRELRLIRGLVGQERHQMNTEYYAIDTTDGPTPQGQYTVIAKDILKLADDDRSQAPLISNGKLAGSIDNSTTSATLSPAGIGDAEYAASGYVCLGGKEVVAFTRTADALTITRGQFGSIAQSHNSGDRVQKVLRYDGDDVADVLYELLTEYVPGITEDMITLSDWQTETSTHLGVIYATTITEPTGVRKLITELIDQASLALFWDAQARQIRLKVLREISTDVATFTEDQIIEGSLSVKEQPQTRISQLWTFYGERDPTDRGGKEDNFRAALATADLAAESAYGAPAIQRVSGRWLATETAASRHNQIKISRFINPPRGFSFRLWQDATIALGEGYQIKWKQNQDSSGLIVPAPIQITSIKRDPDFIHVTAEEMLASGVIVLVHVVLLRTTGSLLSWTVDDSWNDDDNMIAVIAGGGGGHSGNTAGGRGGGGGAYSHILNADLTPAASVSYRVGAGGPGGTFGAGTNGEDTWFGGATLGASLVGSKGGQAGTSRTGGGIGGAAASGVGTTKTSGGDGGVGGNNPDNSTGSGGGGGAGGPNGNGANGGDVGSNDRSGAGGGGADGGSRGDNAGNSEGPPGDGGDNRFGFGGGTSTLSSGQEGGGGRGSPRYSNAGTGGNGEPMWTQTSSPIISAGPGGGGGGGADSSSNAGDGGLYGAGGGGSRQTTAGNGAQGVIMIRWREAS